MTMIWPSRIGRTAIAARTSIGRIAVSGVSVLAITAFLVLPCVCLLLLVVDGYFFPVRDHALNVVFMYAFCDLSILVNLMFFWEIYGNEPREVRFWEAIVQRGWLYPVFGGMAIGGVFYWLGVHSAWKWAIEQSYQIEAHFWGLVLAAPAASLYAIVGRLFLCAETLRRGHRGGASAVVFTLTFFVSICSFCLSTVKIHDVINWPEWGMVQGLPDTDKAP
jgi:hypothetical protein